MYQSSDLSTYGGDERRQAEKLIQIHVENIQVQLLVLAMFEDTVLIFNFLGLI
jgi:hypothetical protein